MNTSPHRVLLAEDDQELRKLFTDILEADGCRVEAVADGRIALERIAASPDAFDLVITDWTMPGASGAEVIRAAKEYGLKAILVSAGSKERIEAVGFAAGADAVLRKPDDVGQIIPTMRRILGG